MSGGRSFGREKAAVRIAQDIVRSIRRDGLGVGARLPPEKAMLEAYEVGRGTLREGLRYLELQGILRIKPGPGGGPIVQSPDSGVLANTIALLLEFADARFRTIAESRRAIEPMVARLAAERISEESLSDLKKSVETMEANVEDQYIFLEENRRFHDVIAWSSGNVLFGHLIDSMLGISDGSVLGTDYPPHRREAICVAHRDILTAIEDGDAEVAYWAMERHIEAFIDYIEVKYPAVLDAPILWEQFS